MIETSQSTNQDNWIRALGVKRETIPVLIVGNNPIEMTSVFNYLVSNGDKYYQADVCFDVKDSFHLISKQKPKVILVDDNISTGDTNKLVKVLRHNVKTKDIKIIVLKSSNWNYNVVDNVDDYILKETLNSSIIDKLIRKNLYNIETFVA